jgi:hypothetical protein
MEKNNQKSQVFASSNRLESNPQKNPSKIDTTITTEELSMAFKTEFSQHQFINPKTTALGELQKSERTNLLAKSEFDRKLDLKKITENPGGQMFRKAGKASESKRISKRENELEELGNIINSETHKQCSLGRKGAQGEEKEVRETHSEKRLYEVTEEKGENSLKKGKLLPINGTTPIPTIQEPQIEEEAKKLIQTISQYSPHTKSPIRTQFSSIERTHPQRQKNDSSEIIIEGSERSLEEEAIFERKLQIMKNEGAERFELELSGSVVEVPSIAIEIDKERKVVLETNVEEVNRKRLHKRTTRDNDPFSQNQNVSKKKKLELDLDFNLSSHICRNRQEPQLFKVSEYCFILTGLTDRVRKWRKGKSANPAASSTPFKRRRRISVMEANLKNLNLFSIANLKKRKGPRETLLKRIILNCNKFIIYFLLFISFNYYVVLQG